MERHGQDVVEVPLQGEMWHGGFEAPHRHGPEKRENKHIDAHTTDSVQAQIHVPILYASNKKKRPRL